MIELIDEVPVGNELGEGIIWNQASQRALWTDIERNKLFSYDPNSQSLETWETPERLCCFAPVMCEGKHHDYLVAAFESGFAYYQPRSGKVEWIKKIETDNPGTRMNDGRTDRQGRFWAGSMVEDEDKAIDKGRLYCLDHDLRVRSLIDGLSITNSLCWSPDSSTLYHCDTPSRTINAYAYDHESQTLGDSLVFTKTEPNHFPDGSIIDSHGFLWNAQWGGSKVVRYSPQGQTEQNLDLPVSQPSCVAFGGADLSLLFVTSARQNMSREQLDNEPGAGNLLVYKTPFTGLSESPFLPKSSHLPITFS